MIEKISKETNSKIFKEIVYIHKQCVSISNSHYYDTEQIKEWLSIINIRNIKNQLSNTSWIIVKEKDDIIGFAQYSRKNKELYQIQVDPNMQKKGYGKELYEYIENDFKKNNIYQISLFSTLNAVEFYKNLGFKVVKRIKFR